MNPETAALNQAVIMRTLMTAAQGERLAATMREAGPLFRTAILNDAIGRLMDAWKGLPYANENNPTTAPDNIAWLHYYTPTEDWLVTRRFFDVRDCKVFCKTMFYAAHTEGLRYTEVNYSHFMLAGIKARNARLDIYWTPKPVNETPCGISNTTTPRSAPAGGAFSLLGSGGIPPSPHTLTQFPPTVPLQFPFSEAVPHEQGGKNARGDG